MECPRCPLQYTEYYSGFLCFTAAMSSWLTGPTQGPRALGDQCTCNKQPSHYPDGPSAQTACLTAWLFALCMKLELKNDSSCPLALCCAHDTARISFTVLMPSLSTTLITKLGGATTSLLRTCTADNMPSSQESGVQTKLILVPSNYSSQEVRQPFMQCAGQYIDSCTCKGI